MEISKELIQGEPVWNDFVAELLRRVPIFSKQDSIKEHKKRHIQPGVELNICHQGRALVVVGNDMFMQSPDQLVLIPGHIPHQIYPDLSSGLFRRSFVCLDEQGMSASFGQDYVKSLDLQWVSSLTSYQFRMPPESMTLIKALTQNVRVEMQTRHHDWETMVFSYLLAISTLLKRETLRLVNGPPGTGEPKDCVQACADFIAANLGEDLSLKRVSRHLQVSQEHLIRLFKREKGMTYHQYVILQRVNESKKLLRDYPELSLTRIAYDVGFTSSSQFSRVFKHIANIPPSQYRLHGAAEVNF